jgi:hypothetical protein
MATKPRIGQRVVSIWHDDKKGEVIAKTTDGRLVVRWDAKDASFTLERPTDVTKIERSTNEVSP